ncbi:transmembrane protein, putative (macronuclear) [Tetrahymena thermophila SB210]|uniref:Transmembrane protein, putative n=1 Tax=Tetrahymena thermophila (strain SB210) TaxID=312017 RepID=I7M6W3_TETTS|nr:transmembrane protein, putative [Tetrahymena thermophila SB210]EAR87377.2 transmembrane protein, putative [Tetrahymena thermophila SB210]|eukprot:XP_001007622.2 transmembrane protein, putative [Tetrahymena thermophila SB210]
MGLMFEKTVKKQTNQASTMQEDETLNNQVAQDNKIYMVIAFIKKNYIKICVAVLIIISIILVLSFVGNELKSYLVEKLDQYKDLSLTGFIFLTTLGTIMVLIGAPILFFELSLGCILNKYIFAVLIAAFSKLLGIFISYQITQKLLMNYILRKFGNNLYLKLLRKMSKNQPAKAVGMLAIIQIPMLIKNYSLPLFEVHVQYIILVFCSIQVLQSFLFCFIGSTFTPSQSQNIDSQNSIAKDVLTYISYAFTIVAFYIIYKETQKLKQQSEIENQDEVDNDIYDKDLELQQKISYTNTQQLQQKHQIKLVYPNTNQDE